jgi:hypothetical protein
LLLLFHLEVNDPPVLLLECVTDIAGTVLRIPARGTPTSLREVTPDLSYSGIGVVPLLTVLEADAD